MCVCLMTGIVSFLINECGVYWPFRYALCWYMCVYVSEIEREREKKKWEWESERERGLFTLLPHQTYTTQRFDECYAVSVIRLISKSNEYIVVSLYCMSFYSVLYTHFNIITQTRKKNSSNNNNNQRVK